MKELFVILSLIILLAIFVIVNKISENSDKIIVNNNHIYGYKRSKDPYISEKASAFQVKYKLRLTERRSYLRETDNLLKEIENYLESKKFN